MHETSTTNPPKNGRHVEWFMTMVFSLVSLVAVLKHYEGDITDQECTTKWAISGVVIALFFSLISVIGNIAMQERFIGTLGEGAMAIITCAFWAAVLPTIMDPDNDLAVLERTAGIQNANMYFFSWGGFIMSFITLLGFVRERLGSTNPISVSTLGALLMTSSITMIAGARLWQSNSCDKREEYEEALEEACNRTIFAISLGVISSIICVIWFAMMMFASDVMGIYVEAFAGLLVLALWSFGVGYITFGGDSAPASVLGNLYFFTWASFALAVVLFMKGFRNFADRNHGAVEPEQTSASNKAPDVEKQQEPDMEVVDLETKA